MYLDNAIRCIQCSQKFDDDRKPCAGSCTHKICIPCKEKLKEFTCPICDRAGAFKDANPNFAALEMAKGLQEMLKIGNLHAFTPTEQDVKIGRCSECSKHSRVLRLCTDCAEKEGLIRRFMGAWILISENADNQKEFMKTKSTAICSDCSFEGAHKGHRIEVFQDVMKDTFWTKEQMEKMLMSPRTADFASYMEALKMHLFNIEKEKDWPLNPCVLGDEVFVFDPEKQAEIEKVRGEMKKEAMKTRKTKERRDMLILELMDFQLEFLKRIGLKASEIQELEAIRAMFPKWKYVTEKDVLGIDAMLFGKMAKSGSFEAFEVARRADQKVFDEMREEKYKLQLKDDEAGAKFADQKNGTPGYNEAFLEYLDTSINLVKADIQCERAFQNVYMNSTMGFFMQVIALKLQQQLQFLVPFDSIPSPYLNDFLPSHLRK